MNVEEYELPALQEWQRQVAACRREREEPEDQCWHRLASWCDTWAQHNDYVELVLPRLLSCAGSTSRVLEVGPGSGAFTLRLAPAVKEIIAIEPSPAMRDVLSCNLAGAGITNVHLIPQRVEDGLEQVDGPFELALASYSLYNVEPIDVVMRSLTHLARHVIILMGSGEQREWRQALRRRFKGKNRVPPPQFHPFYAVLLEAGTYADVEIIWTSHNYVYESEDALVRWWMTQLHLNETHYETLQAALLKVAERRGDHIGIYDRRRMALIWIDSARSVLGQGGDEQPGIEHCRL